MSPTSAPEKLSRRREAELVAATARLLRTGFPNPERTGCPAREELQSVARKALGPVEYQGILDHLNCCSPCFVEYEHLLRKERVLKSAKILALCACLLIGAGLAVWHYVFRGGQGLREPAPTIVRQPAPQGATPFEIAVLDLRNRSPVRGEQQPAPGEAAIASLPPRLLDLSVYLPIGSEEGDYEMQILRDAATPLVTQSGTATLEDRNVILRLRTNLTGLAPGRYLLGVRKAAFRWMYYPIAITN
jgi:hypothetical protein